jgi:CheY-like chemotaxis protein
MARVLVVDDDPSMLAALAALLRSSGHEAIPARSPREALTLVDGGIEAIVTDYSMPEMNGVKLIQVIQQRDEGSRRSS